MAGQPLAPDQRLGASCNGAPGFYWAPVQASPSTAGTLRYQEGQQAPAGLQPQATVRGQVPLEGEERGAGVVIWRDISMGMASAGRNVTVNPGPRILPQPWTEPPEGNRAELGPQPSRVATGAWGYLPTCRADYCPLSPRGKVENTVCIEGTWRVLSLGVQPTFPRHCHSGLERSAAEGTCLPQSLHPEPRQEEHVWVFIL